MGTMANQITPCGRGLRIVFIKIAVSSLFPDDQAGFEHPRQDGVTRDLGKKLLTEHFQATKILSRFVYRSKLLNPSS